MKGDDLYKEREHIKFWDDCLNDLKKQFDIMSNCLDMIRKIKIRRMTELDTILSNFKTDITPYIKEPSHLYSLCEIYFEFLSYLWEVINKFNDELYNKMSSMNSEIIKDLDIKRINLYKDNISLIDECQKLINEIKTQENEFNKKKELMNEAQLNRNKIKNQIQNKYNVSENKKADLLLAKSIKKMEEIKIPIEENKKKLKEFRGTLIASFSLVFENYFFIYFKHLAILHQYFYLLENNKMNILQNMQKQIKKTLFAITNLNFELNDYTEKKFGELLNIKYDGIILLDSNELLNNANSQILLKISNNILNFVKVFMICLKYRKKIMKHFCETVKSIYKLELNIQTENNSSYENLLTKLKLIKYISESMSKRLNNLINKLLENGDINNYEIFISSIEKYINFSAHEFNEFDLNWREYEDKIIERQNIVKNSFRGENNTLLKSNTEGCDSIFEINKKFREIIKSAIKFIKGNINNIRAKDKNQMQALNSLFEKLIIKNKNLVNKKIDLAEVQISNLATLDIFEESKVIIIKYFNDVKIRNYMGFLDKMKIKLISQFQNEDEKETEQLNENKFNPNNVSMNSDNFNESQSQIFLDNSKEEESEINNLNILFKDSRRFLFDNNPKNIKSSIINKDNNDDENNDNNIILKESTPIRKNIKNIDNISLDLLNRNKFTELTKIENPYENIKEEELKKLKEISTKKDEEELEQGEIILDNFNCALRDKILLQGKFFITNKRIWFRSLFNPSTLFGKTTIMIPLTDIISVDKKYYLALDNSIEVKTEKVSYFFTNYLSRDECYDLLQEELNKIIQTKSYKSNTKRKFSEKKISNPPTPQTPKHLQNFNIHFSSFLINLNFSEKLKQITKERMNLFIKKYRSEKNLTFLSEKNNFSEKIFEHTFKSCPLYICFKYICNASTQLDELGFSKGFFESILIQHFSKDIIIIEKEDNESEKESWEIPNYFIDGDYVIDLFSSFEKYKFENLLNDAQNWIHKYEYNCYGMNKKIQKNSKSDLYSAYFISPTLLIFDIIHYSTNNNFLNNYTPIFRYKFDSNIEFNQSKGKFDISTKLTVLFDIIYDINCILSNEERNKILNEYKNNFKDFVLGKLIDVLNNYTGNFRDIYNKLSEENINRKSKNEKMIELSEFDLNENNNKNDIKDFDEFEQNYNFDDIKTIKSIEINNIKITNENNFIKNISLTSNNNIINIDKKQTEKNNINNEEKNQENKNINDENNKNIKSKSKLKEINLILVIIIILMLIVFLLTFLKSEKMFINIINLICLALAIYLLIKGR